MTFFTQKNKIVVSALTFVILLTTLFTIFSSAANTEVQFSVKGSTAKPGETVEVKVFLDKNPGVYSCRFDLNYDAKAVKLLSVQNGQVFSDEEYKQDLITSDGMYKYFAIVGDDCPDNTNTGLCLTATFEVLKTTVNGNYPITITYPNDGDGWFFSSADLNRSYSVSTVGSAAITVHSSSVTSGPVTDAEGLLVQEIEDTTTPVTAYLTDDSGNLVYNDNGEIETYIIYSGKYTDAPQLVTDSNGNFIKDENGFYETYFADANGNVYVKPIQQVKQEETGTKMQKIIIALSIVLTVIISVIIVIVVSKVKIKKKNSD